MRRCRAPRKEPRDWQRLLLLSCNLKRWSNKRLILWLPSPLPGHSYLPKLPQARQQVQSFLPRYPAQMRRPANDAMCAWTVGAALPTLLCWSATGACTRVSDPSPAQSAACVSRGSLRWKRTNGSIVPVPGVAVAVGLGSGLCLVPQSEVTGIRQCSFGTIQTSLRSVGELKSCLHLEQRMNSALRTEGVKTWEMKFRTLTFLKNPL